MGATGDGKGIVARYLLSKIVQSQPWFIRLHDPQHGSAEDYWGIPKVSQSGDELKQALRAITAQMIDREKSKKHSPVTLDILDEIDTQLDKSDKSQFLNLVSRIRHLGMKLILIGQNPKVSRAGFQWADMEQMICLYQGSSSLDAIKNNPALELKKDVLLKQYGEISTAIQAKNEWLDDAKKHYFGLCVIPGKSPQWYSLPVAETIEIESGLGVLLDSFPIHVDKLDFIAQQNSAKFAPNLSPYSLSLTSGGEAVPQFWWESQAYGDQGDNGTIEGGSATGDTEDKPKCKKHPAVRLTQGKDGRYYCSGCKKKLRKNQINWQ
jgi:hypothetical protein